MKVFPALMLGGLVAAVSSCSLMSRFQEEEVSYQELPVVVQSAVKAKTKGDIREIEKEYEDGQWIYEVKTSEAKYEFSTTGELLEEKSRKRCHGKKRDRKCHGKKHDHKGHGKHRDHKDEQETEITFAQLPAVVQAAVKANCKGEISEIEKEVEHGVVFYEVEAEDNGSEFEYKFSEAGKLLEVEKED